MKGPNLSIFYVNRTRYKLIQYISSLFCILHGCSQVDYIGEQLFPNINQFYVKSYYKYVRLVPWGNAGLNPSAEQFRAVLGHITLASGILLLFNIKVRLICVLMFLIGAWSTYAHTVANDPLYMAIITGLFCIHVFILVVVQLSVQASADNHSNGYFIYNYIQFICGLYFVLQGCAQVDFTGKRFFPEINNVFMKNYYNYVKSIPWSMVGLNPSADNFREIVGYFILVSGILLLANIRVKLISTLMCILAAWSVYAHNMARDPTYMAVLGGCLCILMFALAIRRPVHLKVD